MKFYKVFKKIKANEEITNFPETVVYETKEGLIIEREQLNKTIKQHGNAVNYLTDQACPYSGNVYGYDYLIEKFIDTEFDEIIEAYNAFMYDNWIDEIKNITHVEESEEIPFS